MTMTDHFPTCEVYVARDEEKLGKLRGWFDVRLERDGSLGNEWFLTKEKEDPVAIVFLDEEVDGDGLYAIIAHESAKEKGTVVVMLLPARTDTRWFHDYIMHRTEIRLLKGRVRFELDGKPMESAPFPSMIVVFRAAGA